MVTLASQGVHAKWARLYMFAETGLIAFWASVVLLEPVKDLTVMSGRLRVCQALVSPTPPMSAMTNGRLSCTI